LDNDYIDFDNPTQKLINLFFANSLKDNKINIIMTLNDEHQELSPGKIKIKDINVNKKQNNKEIKISFAKDVLPYIIPLTCILTIKDKNKDFIHMLNYIKENEELLEIFDEQCLIWWDKTDLINIIRNITNEYFDKSSNVYNVSIQFKLAIQSLLDSPKELLELISNCLKPKTIEKKTFGEVFTPMNFINDNMLKDIEIYWFQNKNENIWENENLTWYDPTAGMGNYPIAIYYKLIEGLKSKIPNNEQRKKHIIEKQLYMGEINKKNCFIIKQIFNLNNEYELNLYEGDTLNIKINVVFNISKFDIIIGNPPYNEILTKVGAKPLYNKFIEFYVDKCDLLSFIIPSRWFASGKGLNKFREMMINRTDIVYIKHYNDAREIFGNIVNIEGGVNYFLIDKNYNGLCNYNNINIKLDNFDIVIDSKYQSLINKFSNIKSIADIYLGRYFCVESNDKKLTDNNKLLKCYVSQQKGFIKYIDKDYIKKEYNFFKVITARANGKNGCFGNIFIGNQLEIHTGSYISFKVSNENEAKSLLSYMKCKLPNFMLSLRKLSQDISASTCKWIPLIPLNKEWNDEKVYKYFELSDDEIKLIKNTKIRGYKNK
jgi:site-specific DNA-methyltransferase (adenine-specific)